MRYKLLGKSGLRVSELCLGTMTFGEEWGWGASKAESQKVFDTFVEAGGNFVDTANLYTNGTSEKYVGEFMGDKRDEFVLATKYTLGMRRGDPNASGNHRKNMTQALEASLKRLNTDYIDLYWVHAWDTMTPTEEMMRALDDMVRAGKILYIGVSDTPAWVVSRSNTLAELRGWTQFVALQIEYSLIERTVERDLMPMARAFDLAVTPWGCLGSGVLTGKYNKDPEAAGRVKQQGRITERGLEIAGVVLEVAEEIGCEASQVALSWIRQQAGVVIPIVGAKSATQLEDNLKCLNINLSSEHLTKLNEVSKIELGFPHRFLQSEQVLDIAFGGTYDSIDNHRTTGV